eukprot:377605-Rhodomonas_salina.1
MDKHLWRDLDHVTYTHPVSTTHSETANAPVPTPSRAHATSQIIDAGSYSVMRMLASPCELDPAGHSKHVSFDCEAGLYFPTLHGMHGPLFPSGRWPALHAQSSALSESLALNRTDHVECQSETCKDRERKVCYSS